MKKFSSFFLTLMFSVSMFAAETIEAEVSGEIDRWGGDTDMYFDMPQANVDGQIWNVTIDPAMELPSDHIYPWGTILTSDDEWEELKVKKGFVACSNLHDFRFCAKLDAEGKQQWELEAYATTGGTEYFFHFYHNVPAGTNLFEVPTLEADYDIEATDWDSQNDKTDTYFYVYGKDADGKSWKFEIDPLAPTTEWVFGATYTDKDFDYGYTKVGSSPAGIGKMTAVKTFTMALDGAEKISYVEAWFEWNGKYIHLHYGDDPSEEEDGEIELVSSDMKDGTADGADVYIDTFTAKDTKGRTWSFCFDPKEDSAEKHYPWGTTMSLSDLDSDPRYTYVKLDGKALTLTSVSLFMDLSDDNGKPYLDATIEGTLDEQEYHIHVTANKPAPATEILATSLTSQVLYNGKAELEFKDAAGNTVTIDFKESVVYFDQVYNYTSKLDSITGIMTKYNGATEAMNAGASYNCKASFLATKGEGNDITIALSYTTNRNNKYKLSYTGAYTGSVIGYPIVEPDTIEIAAPMAAAVESVYNFAPVQTIRGASSDSQNSFFFALSVGSLLGDEGEPAVFTKADLTADSKFVLDGTGYAIETAQITIQKGLKGAYQLEAYLTSAALENKVYHFTTNAFGYQYAYEAKMILVDEDEKTIAAKSGDIEAYFYFGGESMPIGMVTTLLEGSSINMEAIIEAELTINHSEEDKLWLVSGYVKTEASNTYTLNLTSALPDPSATLTLATSEAEWLDASRESSAWVLNYAINEEAYAVEGSLFFADYSDDFVRSYSEGEILMFNPELMYYGEQYPDGTAFTIVEANDIEITTDEQGEIATLTGTLIGINEQNIVFQFDLNISGAYPAPAAKENDNEEEAFIGEEIGEFYIAKINYDELFGSTTFIAYTEDSTYMAQIVINDGESSNPGIMPLAVSEGWHMVSDDATVSGVCVGGSYFMNEIEGVGMLAGSGVAKLDEDGNIITPMWLLTNGMVGVEGSDESLQIVVSGINSYGLEISLEMQMPAKTPSAVEGAQSEVKSVKLLRNGALIIRKGEVEYNVLGAKTASL